MVFSLTSCLISGSQDSDWPAWTSQRIAHRDWHHKSREPRTSQAGLILQSRPRSQLNNDRVHYQSTIHDCFSTPCWTYPKFQSATGSRASEFWSSYLTRTERNRPDLSYLSRRWRRFSGSSSWWPSCFFHLWSTNSFCVDLLDLTRSHRLPRYSYFKLQESSTWWPTAASNRCSWRSWNAGLSFLFSGSSFSYLASVFSARSLAILLSRFLARDDFWYLRS